MDVDIFEGFRSYYARLNVAFTNKDEDRINSFQEQFSKAVAEKIEAERSTLHKKLSEIRRDQLAEALIPNDLSSRLISKSSKYIGTSTARR